MSILGFLSFLVYTWWHLTELFCTSSRSPEDGTQNQTIKWWCLVCIVSMVAISHITDHLFNPRFHPEEGKTAENGLVNEAWCTVDFFPQSQWYSRRPWCQNRKQSQLSASIKTQLLILQMSFMAKSASQSEALTLKLSADSYSFIISHHKQRWRKYSNHLLT